MNYDPPHLLPFATPVPSSTYPALTPPCASPPISSFPFLSVSLFLPHTLSLPLYLCLSDSLVYVHHCPPLSRCTLLAQDPAHQVLRRHGGLPGGLRSSCRLAGNAVPGAARTLRMVTKGAPAGSSGIPGRASPLFTCIGSDAGSFGDGAHRTRMERYRSVTARLQR